MYRKKLGVKVMTVIATASLVAGNISAVAATANSLEPAVEAGVEEDSEETSEEETEEVAEEETEEETEETTEEETEETTEEETEETTEEKTEETTEEKTEEETEEETEEVTEEETEEVTEEETEEVTEEETEEVTEEETEETTEEETEEAVENTDVNVVVKPNRAPAANVELLVDEEEEIVSGELMVKVVFVDEEGNNLGGGDTFVTVEDNYFDYAELEEMAPEGYELPDGQCEYVADEAIEVVCTELQEAVSGELMVKVVFVDEEGNNLGGGDTFVTVEDNYFDYADLEEMAPEGYQLPDGQCEYVADEAIEVVCEKMAGATVINVVFVDSQGNNLGGGDCFVDEDGDGIFNYNELESIVPDGYKLAETGDAFVSNFAESGTEIKVIRDGSAVINVVFVDSQGNNLGGGDCFVDEDGDGIFNYSELESIVPDGYKLAETGDAFVSEFAESGTEIKVIRDGSAVINVVFVDSQGNNLGGGDCFVDEDGDGIFNYNELESIIPEGYKLQVTGDAFVSDFAEPGTEIILLRDGAAIINVVFEDSQGNNLGGGDCFVDADGDGIFNYSELDEIIPEGYKLAVTGDAFVSDFAEDGTVLRVVRDGAAIINVVFVDSQGNNLGGGDYFVDEDGDGIFNYSELILPEGYKLKVTGDAFVSDFAEPGTEITLLRDGAAIIHVVFVDKDGNNLGGGDYFVDEDGDGIFNFSELLLPEGYELIVTGDAFVNDYLDATITLNKIGGETPEPEPETQTVTVSYVDQETNKTVGTAILTVDAEATEIDPSGLKVPEGYELVSTEAVAIVNNAATVYVKSTSTTTPEEPDDPNEPDEPETEYADAVLNIHYINRSTNVEVGHQTLKANGEVGEEATFNEGALTLPNRYRLADGFETVTVAYGNTMDVNVLVYRMASSSGGGSGSSGGGSGAVSTTALTNGQWILDNVGWWYQYTNGSYAQNGWYSLEWQGNTDWYYFDANGYLVSGWLDNNGNRYFLHDVHDGTFGRMYKGWNRIVDQWYYFNDTAEGTEGALVPDAQVPAELLNQ